MKQNEFKGLDKKVKSIYDYGCYFLDLLYVSKCREPTLEEIIKYYDTFTAKGWMDEECFVKNPCAILGYITGRKYSVTKDVVFDPSAVYIIGYFYNPNTTLLWNYGLKKYEEMVHFDGIWLDMNETVTP